MLRFTMDVLAADTRHRMIEGVIVPYGETAEIDGQAYRFLPGSAVMARTRTPLLLDHDRGRPVGVLASLTDGEQGPVGRFRIDQTPAGDEALAQAASGSRGAFSIGATVDASSGEDVIDVSSASIHEVSLVALGAFAGANVTSVAAEAPPEPETPAEPSVTEEEEDDEDEEEEAEQAPGQEQLPDTPQEGDTVTATAPPVILAADRSPARRELNAGELVGFIIRAQHGEPEARRYLEAALTETISTDVSGLLPPTYEKTVLGGKQIDRPLYNAFRSGALPGVGLQVNKPKWTTPPNGAWAANVDADATTAKVVIGSQAATVQRWDWAGAISWVVVQRSDPGIIDVIYSEAVQDFYYDVEAKIGGQLTPAAAGTSTTLGAALAEFRVGTGNQRSAELIIMAPDVWGKFVDKSDLAVSMLITGASASGGLSVSGASVVVSGTLAAGQVVLATRRAVDARITEPVRLTANAIGALNVELAVVGEGLFDTDYPAELMKFAAIVP